MLVVGTAYFLNVAHVLQDSATNCLFCKLRHTVSANQNLLFSGFLMYKVYGFIPGGTCFRAAVRCHLPLSALTCRAAYHLLSSTENADTGCQPLIPVRVEWSPRGCPKPHILLQSSAAPMSSVTIRSCIQQNYNKAKQQLYTSNNKVS